MSSALPAISEENALEVGREAHSSRVLRDRRTGPVLDAAVDLSVRDPSSEAVHIRAAGDPAVPGSYAAVCVPRKDGEPVARAEDDMDLAEEGGFLHALPLWCPAA